MSGRISGFTLIELLVVLFLLSLMVFFSVPRLAGVFSDDSRDTVSRWVIAQTASMRIKAVQQNCSYLLQVDIGEDAFRVIPAAAPSDSLPGSEANREMAGGVPFFNDTAGVTSDGTTGEFTGGAASKELLLSDDVDIVDVLFPEDVPITSGSADICFYGQGYSDRALIHVKAGDDRFSLYIAPFLPHVKIYDGFINFTGGAL